MISSLSTVLNYSSGFKDFLTTCLNSGTEVCLHKNDMQSVHGELRLKSTVTAAFVHWMMIMMMLVALILLSPTGNEGVSRGL